MSTVHGEDAEPHVFAALHMLSGWGSLQAYLLFCALANAELRTIQNNKTKAIEKVRGEKKFTSIARPHFQTRIFTGFQGFSSSSNSAILSGDRFAYPNRVALVCTMEGNAGSLLAY
jgi:hypothetical protein